jgi:hypothetical protein
MDMQYGHAVRTCSRDTVHALLKKPCRNAPNSDADNGGAELNNVGVGIFRPPRYLVRATAVHIGISRSFFYSVDMRHGHEAWLRCSQFKDALFTFY